MNYLANFNQTWWETCLRDGDGGFRFVKRGPIRGKIRKMLIKIFFS